MRIMKDSFGLVTEVSNTLNAIVLDSNGIGIGSKDTSTN